MKTTHTPGPWVVHSADWDRWGNARYTLEGVKLIGKADALLISAAPDLLKVATYCASRFRQYADHHTFKGDTEKAASNAAMAEMCENVIAKATGGGV